MSTQRALVLKSKGTPLSVENVPIPTAGPGSVVVKVLGTYILSYLSSVLDGSAPYQMSLPLTPGANSIGRIHAIGPDSTVLKAGQLVFCSYFITARDDPDGGMLMGSKKFPFPLFVARPLVCNLGFLELHPIFARFLLLG